MRRFSFNLQSVLSIRNKLEEQAKMNFGIAKAKLIEEERKRDLLIGRIEMFEDRLRELTSSKLNILQIRQCEESINVLKDKLSDQIMAVKRADRQAELARIKLNEAVMDRKTIEKLRENAFDDYMKEYNSEENRQIDELTSYRYTVGEDAE